MQIELRTRINAKILEGFRIDRSYIDKLVLVRGSECIAYYNGMFCRCESITLGEVNLTHNKVARYGAGHRIVKRTE